MMKFKTFTDVWRTQIMKLQTNFLKMKFEMMRRRKEEAAAASLPCFLLITGRNKKFILTSTLFYDLGEYLSRFSFRGWKSWDFFLFVENSQISSGWRFKDYLNAHTPLIFVVQLHKSSKHFYKNSFTFRSFNNFLIIYFRMEEKVKCKYF